MTFPRNEGQIPIYYNYLNTGRPPQDENANTYVTAYIDVKNTPKFVFGHGLSYTTFKYDNLKLSKKKLNANESIEVSLTVTNTGKYAGEEVIQLYLRDRVASLVRPVKELKDFSKIMLQAGETKTVKFVINKEKLSFYNQKLEWVAEPGDFDLMIGSSSADIRLKDSFELTN
jgi:beta-glucosidase